MSAVADTGLAVVIGTGGIGSAIAARLRESSGRDAVLLIGRRGHIALDLTDESSIARAAAQVAARAGVGPGARAVRRVIVATGVLQHAADADARAGADVNADPNPNANAGPADGIRAEKTWRELDASRMARAFAVNAIGPALLMKHFLPLLPRQGRAVFAVLSAKVGSIGDNRLGGWYSYRASKAALNQLVRTAAIELRRSRPEALCVALHPGTVDTALSRPFRKAGLDVQTPEAAAARLVHLIDTLGAEASGGFFSRTGEALPW